MDGQTPVLTSLNGELKFQREHLAPAGSANGASTDNSTEREREREKNAVKHKEAVLAMECESDIKHAIIPLVTTEAVLVDNK